MNISQINGWQRLFIVIGILVAIFTYIDARVPIEKLNLEPYLIKMSPKYAASLEKTDSNFAKFFLGENIEEFKTPDGDTHLADKGTLTQDQVDKAFKLASEDADKAHWDKSVKSFSQAFKNYIIGMLALYGLGWSVAWVRRGFKK